MASRVYFLNSSSVGVDASAAPATIGIASTVVHLRRTGGSIIKLGDSGTNAAGRIGPLAIGQFSDLSSGVLTVTTVVDLIAVESDAWDKAFQDAQVDYGMRGGLDGEQHFNVDIDDKMQIMDKRMIVITKAIKFSLNQG